jgi:hypothetical protein
MSENIDKTEKRDANNPQPDPEVGDTGLDSKSEAEEKKSESDPKEEEEDGSGADIKSKLEDKKPTLEETPNNEKVCVTDQDIIARTDLSDSVTSIENELADHKENIKRKIDGFHEETKKELEELKEKISENKRYAEEKITQYNQTVLKGALKAAGEAAREWLTFDQIVHKTGELHRNLHDYKKKNENLTGKLTTLTTQATDFADKLKKSEVTTSNKEKEIESLEEEIKILTREKLEGADRYALSVWPVELRECIGDDSVVMKMTEWFENDKIPEADLTQLMHWVYARAIKKEMDNSDLFNFSKVAWVIFNKDSANKDIPPIIDGFAKWMSMGDFDVSIPGVSQQINPAQHNVQNGSGNKIKRIHSFIVSKGEMIVNRALVDTL